MKDLYKSFVKKVLVISFISAFFFIFSNTGFSQWRQTNGPQGAEMEKVVYNGTNTLFAQSSHFIYRSYNNGNSWTLLNCPSKNPSNIFAKNAMVFVEDGNGGVYRSTNSGTNWDSIAFIGNNLINTLAFYNDSVYISISGGMYISPDKGTTWTYNQNSILPEYFGNELFFVGSTLYASCWNGNTYGFIKSTDFGRNFTKIVSSNTPVNQSIGDFIYVNGDFYSAFNYDGVYKSNDDCQTWTKLISVPESQILKLKYGNGKLYAYSYDTLYMSADLGNTWSLVSSFSSSLYNIEFSGSRMFASLYKPGVMRSTNGGYNWTASYSGMRELLVSGLLTIGNYVIASNNGTGISRTTGTTWQKYSGDLPNDLVSAIYQDSNRLYAGLDGDLYRSTNNGLNWNMIYDGSTTTTIACIYADKDNIFYGTSRRGLFISNDNGSTWNTVTSTSGITSIEKVNEYVYYSTHNTHSAPSGSVYRSSDNGLNWTNVSIPNSPRPQTAQLQEHNGNIYAISKSNLYKSTNLGLNWIKYQAPFEDSLFNCIHSDKGIMYCGTSTKSGKYYLRYSIDNGATFNKLGDTLPAEVTDIAIKGNYIYAGVKYYSVWRINKSIITSENTEPGIIPVAYILKQNYPNPFNPTTKINFSLPKQGFVTLKIYDMLGREVRTLVNEVKSIGNYSVDFNASEFSSGVYFYKLEADGFSDIKKMMLIK